MQKNDYDLIIVGAGPAGTTAARFAAEQGVSVLVLEKDRDVGYPVRCGEAIRRRGIEEFIEPDDKWICAYIDKFSMIAPNGVKSTIEYIEKALILERRIFDYELAKLASKAGAEIITRCYVNGLLLDNGKVTGVKYVQAGEEKTATAKIVIAADGVESRVGRWAGLETHTHIKNMESCVQVTASTPGIELDTCRFYFGKDIAPEGYLWIFPKGKDISNIGLGVSATMGKTTSALTYLNRFMENNFPNSSITSIVSGGVPCVTTLKKMTAPGIMLVGDAAHQVNPLSGGGITSGMVGGKLAGTIAGKSIKQNKPDLIYSYESEWHERMGKRHETYDRIKDGFYKFSDETFNNLAEMYNKLPYEKRTIGRLFTTALINKPSLLLDVAKVFIM